MMHGLVIEAIHRAAIRARNQALRVDCELNRRVAELFLDVVAPPLRK